MSYNPLAFGMMLVALGTFFAAVYVYKKFRYNIKENEEKTFGAISVVLGLVGTVFAFIIFLTEPIPAQYIEVYGIGYFSFGIMMIAAGLALYYNWDKKPVSYLGVGIGALLINSAYAIHIYSLSRSPRVTALMFLLAGIISGGSVFYVHSKKTSKWMIVLSLVVLLAFVVVALSGGLQAQLGHVASSLAQ